MVVGQASIKLFTLVELKVVGQRSLVYIQTKLGSVNNVSMSSSENHHEKVKDNAAVGSDRDNNINIPKTIRKNEKPSLRCWTDSQLCGMGIVEL